MKQLDSQSISLFRILKLFIIIKKSNNFLAYFKLSMLCPSRIDHLKYIWFQVKSWGLARKTNFAASLQWSFLSMHIWLMIVESTLHIWRLFGTKTWYYWLFDLQCCPDRLDYKPHIVISRCSKLCLSFSSF